MPSINDPVRCAGQDPPASVPPSMRSGGSAYSDGAVGESGPARARKRRRIQIGSRVFEIARWCSPAAPVFAVTPVHAYADSHLRRQTERVLSGTAAENSESQHHTRVCCEVQLAVTVRTEIVRIISPPPSPERRPPADVHMLSIDDPVRRAGQDPPASVSPSIRSGGSAYAVQTVMVRDLTEGTIGNI